MSGIIEAFLAVSGLGRSAPQPARRRRAAPAAPPRRRAPAVRQPQVSGRQADRFADGFGAPAPAADAPSRAPARRTAPPPPPPRRRNGFNGFGMVVLAILCIGTGGWLGSQVQAFAKGAIAQVGPPPADPAEMRPVDGPTFTF